MVFDPSEIEGPKFDCIYIAVTDVILHWGGGAPITLLNSATFLEQPQSSKLGGSPMPVACKIAHGRIKRVVPEVRRACEKKVI
jgi:hypothetical protein